MSGVILGVLRTQPTPPFRRPRGPPRLTARGRGLRPLSVVNAVGLTALEQTLHLLLKGGFGFEHGFDDGPGGIGVYLAFGTSPVGHPVPTGVWASAAGPPPTPPPKGGPQGRVFP